MVDEQHRKLVELLNRIDHAVQDQVEVWIVGTFIQDLEDYTKFHFSAEVNLMKQFGYPQADTHEDKHEWFVQKLREAVEDYRNGHGEKVLRDLRLFLKTWLVQHILGTDKEMCSWLIDHGAK